MNEEEQYSGHHLRMADTGLTFYLSHLNEKVNSVAPLYTPVITITIKEYMCLFLFRPVESAVLLSTVTTHKPPIPYVSW